MMMTLEPNQILTIGSEIDMDDRKENIQKTFKSNGNEKDMD